MATRGWLSVVDCCEDEWELVDDFEGVGMPFLSARIDSVRVMSGLITFSACAIDVPTIVMCPIFLAGFDSLPYMCREAVGIATAFFINSS